MVPGPHSYLIKGNGPRKHKEKRFFEEKNDQKKKTSFADLTSFDKTPCCLRKNQKFLQKQSKRYSRVLGWTAEESNLSELQSAIYVSPITYSSNSHHYVPLGGQSEPWHDVPTNGLWGSQFLLGR